MLRRMAHSLPVRNTILYSCLVDEELSDDDGPLHIAAGTPGNHRFGALLKTLRERSSLSPQQLADQAGVHVSFVRGIERGAQAPSMDTAGSLLACVREQDRIRWQATGPVDLLIRDPGTDLDTAFAFTAKVKGQNRRTDGGPEIAALRLAATMHQMFPQMATALADPDTGPLASAARLATTMQELGPQMVAMLAGARHEPADHPERDAREQPAPPGPADDTRLGRIVRLLAAADERTLTRVERLLDAERFLHADSD